VGGTSGSVRAPFGDTGLPNTDAASYCPDQNEQTRKPNHLPIKSTLFLFSVLCVLLLTLYIAKFRVYNGNAVFVMD
jgi:hypothetical protein